MSVSPVLADSRRPLRAGLFQFEPPRLLGSRCTVCATTVFPARSFCPACDAETPPERAVLSPHGVVFSYTVVHQAPAGRATPYVLAYLDLADGVRVLAQVDEAPDTVSLGMPVQLRLREVAEDKDGSLVGYVFSKRND